MPPVVACLTTDRMRAPSDSTDGVVGIEVCTSRSQTRSESRELGSRDMDTQNTTYHEDAAKVDPLCKEGARGLSSPGRAFIARNAATALVVLLVLAAGISGTTRGCLILNNEAEYSAREDFEASVGIASNVLDANLQRTWDYMHALTGYVQGRTNMTNAFFLNAPAILRPLDGDTEIMQTGYQPRVLDQDRASFERMVRAVNAEDYNNTFGNYRIRSTINASQPAAPKGEYIPNLYTVPPVQLGVVGVDVSFSQVRYAAVNKSRDSGDLVAVTPTLIIRGTPSVVVYAPLYVTGTVPTLVEYRRGNFSGIVVITVGLSKLVDRVMDWAEVSSVRLYIFDSTPGSPPALIHTPDSSSNATSPSDIPALSGLRATRTVSFADRTYTIVYVPIAGAYAVSHTKAIILGVFSSIGTLLATFIAIYLTQKYQRTSDVRHRALHERDLAEKERVSIVTMLGYMSHELRNTLNGQLALLELAIASLIPHVQSLDSPIAADADKTTKVCGEQPDCLVANGTAHMLRSLLQDLQTCDSLGQLVRSIINDVLDIRKMEEGLLELHETQTTVGEIVAEIQVIAAPIFGGKKHLKQTVVVDDNSLRSVHITVDAFKLKQVVLNFLSNAAKFTPDEPGNSVTFSVGHVTATGASALPVFGGRFVLRFSVTDTGRGIAEDKRGMLFRPYTQMEAADATRHGGTGLGLYLCALLVKLMHGHIGVSSMSGQGSTFWFDIPCGLVAATPQIEAKIRSCDADGMLKDDDTEPGVICLEEIVVAADDGPSANDGRLMTSDASPVPTERDMDGRRRLNGTFPGQPPTKTTQFRLDGPLMASGRLSNGEAGAALCLSDSTVNTLSSAPAPPRHLVHLVCDDGKINRIVLRRFLESFGDTVQEAENGRVAVDLVQSTRFDCIWIDTHMPVLDGISATLEIRQLDARVPIVGVTGSVGERSYASCVAAGMNSVLTKPISRAHIADQLKALRDHFN